MENNPIMEQMPKLKQQNITVRDYLSVCEVAGRLGVCERTVISRIKDGTIVGAIKIGGIWRIAINDLEKTMESLKNAKSSINSPM
jgi:excisionase family DNA binding protein